MSAEHNILRLPEEGPRSMIIYGLRAQYSEGGGSAIFSYVTNLLTVRLGHYGSAIEAIWITVFLRDRTRDPSVALQKLFDDFHEYLPRLPKITFHRRLKRVDIQFASKQFDSEDERGWLPSVDKCNRGMGEVLEALALLKKRVKPSDDFDITRFLADATQLLTTRIESTDEWTRIGEQAIAKELALNATKSAWDLLEIDWDLYHPAARTILDDPLYWDVVDDFAPHGNDSGADFLEHYRGWEKRNKDRSPMEFLTRELKAWGVPPIDWTITDEAAVRTLAKDKPAEMTLCDQAAIALAFAVLKMRGACPSAEVRIALAAIQRTAIIVKDSSLNDNQKMQWETALTKMKEKLESISKSQ